MATVTLPYFVDVNDDAELTINDSDMEPTISELLRQGADGYGLSSMAGECASKNVWDCTEASAECSWIGSETVGCTAKLEDDELDDAEAFKLTFGPLLAARPEPPVPGRSIATNAVIVAAGGESISRKSKSRSRKKSKSRSRKKSKRSHRSRSRSRKSRSHKDETVETITTNKSKSKRKSKRKSKSKRRKNKNSRGKSKRKSRRSRSRSRSRN